MTVAIATWFVADTPANSTCFPQVGGTSSSVGFQEVYWRCVVGFFSTSKRLNPHEPHLFFTNSSIPVIDGMDLSKFFHDNSITVIHLDITYRLPLGMSKSWGNQFYILDIIKYAAINLRYEKLLVLDSDCVWNGNSQAISDAIDRFGCLTYTLGSDAYGLAQSINGVTRLNMKRALLSWQPRFTGTTPKYGLEYHGGEIFAASLPECQRIADRIDDLWKWQEKSVDLKGFLEEAHFLSILYAYFGYRYATANPYIKRMWTTFKHNNLDENDSAIDIWHLPAEKRFGFAKLFKIVNRGRLPRSRSELEATLSKTMGVPKRSFRKFAYDGGAKIIHRIRSAVASIFTAV